MRQNDYNFKMTLFDKNNSSRTVIMDIKCYTIKNKFQFMCVPDKKNIQTSTQESLSRVYKIFLHYSRSNLTSTAF